MRILLQQVTEGQLIKKVQAPQLAGKAAGADTEPWPPTT